MNVLLQISNEIMPALSYSFSKLLRAHTYKSALLTDFIYPHMHPVGIRFDRKRSFVDKIKMTSE